jgi:outer membrane usher protein FimD/PapC
LKAGFQQDDNQKRYKLGFEHLISNRQQKLGLNLVSVHNMSAMPDDKQIQISYSYKFGEKYSNPAIDWSTNTKNLKWTTSLEDKVVSRSSFIPSSVPTY